MTWAGNCSARSAMLAAAAPPTRHSVSPRVARTPSGMGPVKPRAWADRTKSVDPCAMSASRRRERKDRPRLRKKAASSRLVLPEAFGPTKRFAFGSSSSSTAVRHRNRSARKVPRAIRPGLEAHRHHDVPRAGGARGAHEAARIAVRYADFHFVPVDCRQRIQQVSDVEADFELVTYVGNLDLLFGFFLLGVVRLERQRVLLQGQSDPAVFLIGQDRGPLKRCTKYLPVCNYGFRRRRGYYAAIFRESAVNELRCEANVADLGANVIATDRDVNLTLCTQQSLQFQDAFSRDDHLLTGCLGWQIHLAQCQTMAVSRDRSQHLTVRFQQHSIQVITDVLLGHGEMGLVE